MSTTDEPRRFTVQGMTCAHCVASVTEEVSAIPGVTSVDVDLKTGGLQVSGDGVSDEAIQAAVDEAGYQLVS